VPARRIRGRGHAISGLRVVRYVRGFRGAGGGFPARSAQVAVETLGGFGRINRLSMRNRFSQTDSAVYTPLRFRAVVQMVSAESGEESEQDGRSYRASQGAGGSGCLQRHA